jgi:putative transposase
MIVRVIQIVRLLTILASRHRSLVFENLALRQQLAVYRRTRPKPTVRWSDRVFWVGLRLAWPDWKSALVIVRPATVIAWHRRGSRGTGLDGRVRGAAVPKSAPTCDA